MRNFLLLYFTTDCLPFQLPNGNFRTLNTSVFLFVTSLSCNQGYELNGRVNNHCEYGKWKFPIQTCTRKLPIQREYVLHYCFLLQQIIFTTIVKSHYKL